MKTRSSLPLSPEKDVIRAAADTTIVCIAGMHRSGTSMVGRLLNKCGMYLGDPAEIMPAGEDNAAGFWENLRFVALNDDLLRAADAAWDHPPSQDTDWSAPCFARIAAKGQTLASGFGSHRFWGWKDPRNSLTLRFWLKLFPNLKVVICLRHPLEVAISLHRRNFSSYQLGLTLWTEYNRCLLQSVPVGNRILTHYDAYFDDPKRELSRVLAFLGRTVPGNELEESISTVAKELRHGHFTPADLVEVECSAETVELYGSMSEEAGRVPVGLPRNGNSPHCGAAADLTQGRGRGLQTAILDLVIAQRDLAVLQTQIETRDETIRQLQAEVETTKTALQCRVEETARREAESRELRQELVARSERLGNLQVRFTETHAALLRRDEQIRQAPREPQNESPKRRGKASGLARSEYRSLVERIQSAVEGALPNDATILVISKGDEELLKLGGRVGWHFPSAEGGGYAGHHPADSAAAIAALEKLRERGASYLVIPESSFWWLDFYQEFAAYLETRYCKVRAGDECIVYHLSKEGWATLEAQWAQLLKARSDQVLALLAERARLLSGENGVEARTQARSIDTFGAARLRAFLASPDRLTFPKVAKPAVSIVIPTYNQAHRTFLLLEALHAAREKTGFEIVIVDNDSTDETRTLLGRLDHVTIQLNESNRGFGEASTAGAKLGRGEFICFLNNDTVPVPGWLDALVHTARTYPLCGAVGAKLVHGDGRLQEAGSILWQDGSALGYGRGMDPQDPAYGYLREVDYCSAACLLMPRKLFFRIGGFDERYAPAYYEDTDLCMAIREAGFSVVYQPLATVFHLEFGSSGAARAVELQLKNRKKFVAKWRSELRAQCAPLQRVLFARDRRTGPRVLVVDDRIPHLGAGSGFPRLAAMLRILVKAGYLVTFFARTNPARIEPETTELQQLGIEVLHGIKDFRAALELRAGLFDAAIVSRPHNAPVIATVREANPNAAIIYDAEAICAFREARQAEVEGRPMKEDEFRARLLAELDLMKSADVVLAVSASECRSIQKCSGAIPVELWGDAVEIHRTPNGFKSRRDLLFVGNLATPPNADALVHFSRDILPLIRARVRCRLVVVGADPPPALVQRRGDRDALELMGYVEDLEPVYARCRVFVAPHRFAAGVPRKVIDAMAQGVPCVISDLLATQLGVTDGVEALVARDPDSFMESVLRLYRDEGLWKKVQRGGIDFIQRNFDPAKMAKKLQGCIEQAIGARKGGATRRRPCRRRDE